MELSIKDELATGRLGEFELTPVVAAIARFLGVDLSPEGKAAKNRQGLTLLVHGAPSTGKTTVARAVSEIYGAALLNLDDVIIDAIVNGATPAGIRAREICAAEAARVNAEEQEKEEGMMCIVLLQ